jgi:hypothetical protein
MADAYLLALLRGTVDPTQVTVMPPNNHARVTTKQSMRVNLQFKVDDAAVVVGGCKSSNGMLLWMCNRGVSSISRWGFTNVGQVLTLPDTPNTPPGVYNFFTGFTITFDQPLALPYTTAVNVAVEPQLSKDFTFTRLVAGRVSIESKTIAGTSMSLSGTLTGGTVADTRDVAQANGKAFDTGAVTTQSILDKDQFTGQSIMDGATTLLASDWPATYTVPDPSFLEEINGEHQNFDSSFATSGSTGFTAANSHIFHWTTWITPWETTARKATFVGVPPANSGLAYLNGAVVEERIKTDPINQYGSLDIDLSWTMPGDAGMPGAVPPGPHFGLVYRTMASVIDVFGVINANGSISTTGTHTEPSMYEVIRYSGDTRAQTPHFRHRAQREVLNAGGLTGSAGISDRGLYIGTLVMYKTSCLQMSPTLPAGPMNISLPINVQVRTAANSLFRQGELGPARVIKYENVGDQQQVVITGDLVAEAVPQGSIAPYVNASMLTDGIGLNMNAVPVLSMLYNGNSDLRRMWRGSKYREFEATQLAHLSMELLLHWSRRAPDIVPAMQAGGFFSGLGGALGGMFGAPGSAVGNFLGGEVDSLFSGAQKPPPSIMPPAPDRPAAPQFRAEYNQRGYYPQQQQQQPQYMDYGDQDQGFDQGYGDDDQGGMYGSAGLFAGKRRRAY